MNQDDGLKNQTHEYAEKHLVKSEELLMDMQDLAATTGNTTAALEALRERIYSMEFKLDDLLKHTYKAQENVFKAEDLNGKNRYVDNKIQTVLK